MLRIAVRRTAPKTQVKFSRQVVVNRNLCHICGACIAVCPANALFLADTWLHVREKACTGCERCAKVCPSDALSLVGQD
ncbi:MAG: 4Fe-4S binding protein [Anaerolineae bacterium]|nr:4Fe-4S binding protein [Anaerolineae bacterium]